MKPNPEIAAPQAKPQRGLQPTNFALAAESAPAAGFWVVRPPKLDRIVAVLVPRGLTAEQARIVAELRRGQADLQPSCHLAQVWDLAEVWVLGSWIGPFMQVCGEQPPRPRATFLAFLG
jgi:hypothetical protein